MQLCVLEHRRLSALTAQVQAQLLCAPGTTTHLLTTVYFGELVWSPRVDGGWAVRGVEMSSLV